MSYTSKYTGNEIDELLDKVKVSSGDTLVTNSPIGSIVPYIGVNAPEDYLICDGRELNINEYKELADHFKKEFGTVNHYGGDGETTFTIPDLRNEFLRGYYADKEEQLSGEVGLHQDATVFNKIGIHSNGAYFYRDMSLVTGDWGDANGDIGNHDTDLVTSKENIRYGSLGTVNTTSTEQITMYTSRPTNVAVLFCIKYKNGVGASAVETKLPAKAFLQKKLENISKNTAFDMDIVKNNGFELSNNRILLKANNTYSIRYSVEVFVNASEFGIATTLPIADDSEKWAILYAPSLSAQVGNAGERTIFVTPEQDTELTFITAPYGSSAVGYAWTRCIIEEI
jgi:microcystin-dependent protein